MSVRLPRGAVIALTQDEARFIAFCTNEIRDKHRLAGIDSPALHALLLDLYAVAVAGPLPEIARSAAPGQATGSGWVSTRTAAQRLKISQRGVTSLLNEGRIIGQQQAARSRWRVSTESLEQYRAERAS